MTEAQPSFARATVARYRRDDPDFNARYGRLLTTARQLQRQAGYANANLKRGLTTTPTIRPQARPGVQLRFKWESSLSGDSDETRRQR